MAYTQYTLAQLRGEILSALQDPAGVYWVAAEVNDAIAEGLYCWAGITATWRDQGLFNTSSGAPFYDLSVQLPALRARTVTMGQVTRSVQYALLEPPVGVSGAGMTSQYTPGQLSVALQRARNEFILDAKLPMKFGTFNAPAPQEGLVSLDQNIALTQRVAWRNGISGVYSVLRREDTWGMQAYRQNWTNEVGTPFCYGMAENEPETIQLCPPPAASGDLHIVYADTSQLTVADGTSLGLPDEHAYAVKYYQLYSLFATDGECFDPVRAKYCHERYKQWVEAAKSRNSILQVRINNTPISLDTLWSMDSGDSAWQTRRGQPRMGACTYDVLALGPTPNGTYPVTVDTVTVPPIPAADGEFIQLGREEVAYLMDYCKHILTLKLGGAEFLSTLSLYDNFHSGASQRNKIYASKTRYLSELYGQPTKEESIQPAA